MILYFIIVFAVVVLGPLFVPFHVFHDFVSPLVIIPIPKNYLLITTLVPLVILCLLILVNNRWLRFLMFCLGLLTLCIGQRFAWEGRESSRSVSPDNRYLVTVSEVLGYTKLNPVAKDSSEIYLVIRVYQLSDDSLLVSECVSEYTRTGPVEWDGQSVTVGWNGPWELPDSEP